MSDQTHAAASQTMNAIQALEKMAADGNANERQLEILETLKFRESESKNTIGGTNATYRGLGRGVTMGLSDDIAGVKSMVQGEGFGAGRAESLSKDQNARANFPDEFSAGQTAGSVGSGALSMVAAPAAVGGGLALRSIVGALTGSGAGSLEGQSQFEMDGSPDGKRFDYMKKPAAVGALTGGAAYPLGRVAGALSRGARNSRKTVDGFAAAPTRVMSKAVDQTQEGGQNIRDYLSRLTDESTLADVPGNLQQTAQGLSTVGGPGGQRINRAVNKRGDDAGQRIKKEMDAGIGVENAAFDARRANAVNRSNVLGPQYEAALQSKGALEVSPLINTLKEAQRTAGPDTASTISKYVNDLAGKAENGLIDPVQLHWIRSDLSDELAGLAGPSKGNLIAKTALQEMDKALDTVSGYAEARTGYANNFAMDRAIDEGETALRGGRVSALAPDELAETFGKLSEPQKDAFKKGLRRDISGLMGTSKNDAAAAWGEFNKTWNAEKLEIILGDEAAPIIKRLFSEDTFSKTRGKMVGGSESANRLDAAKSLGDFKEPDTGRRRGIVAAGKGKLDEAGNAVVDALRMRGKGARANANDQLGQMLTATGEDQRKLLENLLRDASLRKKFTKKDLALENIFRLMTAGGGSASISANSER